MSAAPLPGSVPLVDINELDPRQMALYAACIFHGLSCANAQVIPPRADTLVKTAQVFERYLLGEDPINNGR